MTKKGAIAAAKAKIGAKQHARQAAYLATLQTLHTPESGNYIKQQEPYAHYRVTWHYKGNCPDDDNVLARCKYYKDGACLALGIDDKTLRNAGIDLDHTLDPLRVGTVTLTIY
jgi:hypothetical protein